MTRLRLIQSSRAMSSDKSVPTILRIGAYTGKGRIVYSCHMKANRLTFRDIGFGCSRNDAIVDFFGKMGAV